MRGSHSLGSPPKSGGPGSYCLEIFHQRLRDFCQDYPEGPWPERSRPIQSQAKQAVCLADEFGILKRANISADDLRMSDKVFDRCSIASGRCAAAESGVAEPEHQESQEEDCENEWWNIPNAQRAADLHMVIT